jgi:hypothetical protein
MCTRVFCLSNVLQRFLPHLVLLTLFPCSCSTEFHVLPVFGRGLNGPSQVWVNQPRLRTDWKDWPAASDSRGWRLYNQRGGGNSSTGRAPDCGSDGCGFDSRFPPQI